MKGAGLQAIRAVDIGETYAKIRATKTKLASHTSQFFTSENSKKKCQKTYLTSNPSSDVKLT